MSKEESPQIEDTNSILSTENNVPNSAGDVPTDDVPAETLRDIVNEVASNMPSSSQNGTENGAQPPSQPKKKSTQKSQVCSFIDPEKGQCKQRAIVTFKFCIRHILNDSNAPYKRCAMLSKSKKGVQKPCTNAIKNEINQIYCSTHLIMMGELEPKKRKKPGQAQSEGSGEAPPSNTQDSSCFGDDDRRTNISDADFVEIRQSPHPFTPDSEFVMPVTPGPYNGQILTKSPLIRAPVQDSSQGQVLLEMMSPRTILKSPANMSSNITQHQVILPIQSNGITTRIIPTPHNSSSPHLAAHLIQTTPQKTTNIIYNRGEIIVNEPIATPLGDSPRIKIQSTDVNGQPTITFVNGQASGYSGTPIVQRIEVTELPPLQHRPIVRILSKKSPLEFFDAKPRRIAYDASNVKIDDETSELEKLKRDYLSENVSIERKSKIIKLRQKTRKITVDGPFRSIPSVDSMCQIVSDFDFDNTDLFPLGLEPSDDESPSDDDVELNHLPAINVNPKDMKSSRIELYLLKKRLRRESEKLQKNAKLSMSIMQASKSFPDSVGSAFRLRTMGRKRRNLSGLNSSFQQCFYTEQGNKHRCKNICVPRSSLCSIHIGYSVDQRAFVFCKTPCCGKPVSKINSLVFNGMCEEHYLNGGKPTPVPINPRTNYQHPSQNYSNSSVHLNSHGVYRQVHTEAVSATGDMSSSYADTPENYADNQLMNSISMDDFNVSDVVEGDVLLGCVANELMFDNNEINDMLSQFPMEAQNEDHNDLEDNDNLMSVFPKSMKVGSGVEDPDINLWSDITDFLRSEGYSPPPHN